MNNLKQARLAAGLTQKQVAEAVGIAEQAYQKIEYGNHKPLVDMAIKIAKVLETTVEILYPLNNQEKR